MLQNLSFAAGVIGALRVKQTAFSDDFFSGSLRVTKKDESPLKMLVIPHVSADWSAAKADEQSDLSFHCSCIHIRSRERLRPKCGPLAP